MRQFLVHFNINDMKKINIKVMALLLMGSVAYSSCIGSFGLLNAYAKWQTSMTGNKFVNGIVGIILGSVAVPVCMAADLLILNTIEFWSGSNPVASNVGKTQKVLGSDGRFYAVTTLKNGYEVKSPTGEVSYFLHDAQTDTWSLQQNGVTTELFRYNGDGTLTTLSGKASQLTVSADETGLYQMRMAISDGHYFAMR